VLAELGVNPDPLAGSALPPDQARMNEAAGIVNVGRRRVSAVLTTRAIARSFTRDYPRVSASLDSAPVKGWIPVLVKTEVFAGLRWLHLMVEGDAEPRAISESGKAHREALARLRSAMDEI
jgi:hypothetical protein